VSDLSLTEYAVLGVLAEQPSHGFAIARELSVMGDVGRVITVRRPLVYRALDRLIEAGLARPAQVEEGDSGPKRIVHRVTPAGRHRLDEWLSEPVDHVRDMRIEFLLKLVLLRRADRSPARLVAAQRASLEPTLDALDDPETDDPVEVWRRHNARAAASYLDELTALYGWVDAQEG
jgi:DNA-binding PadR family transcriptional regulator